MSSPYSGIWAPHLDLILKLYRDGWTADQIASAVPAVSGYHINGSMVIYILRRVGVIGPSSGRLRRHGERQQQFIEDFNRRTLKWQRGERPEHYRFLSYARGLYATLGWMIAELERNTP